MVKLKLAVVLLAAFLASSSCARSTGVTPAPGFPIRIATAAGTVTISRQPTRIISLSATATEDLYAVGAGNQVVAVDPYSTYPPNAPRTKLSGFNPNAEAIANYRPDLVIVSDDVSHIVSQLGKLGITVLVEPAAQNLDAAYSQIEQIAKATGHVKQGQRVVDGVRSQIQQIVSSTPHPGKTTTVYHELDQTFYSATSHTFIGQIYTLFGLQNIADRAGRSGNYPQLSAEYIIASDPDLIVLADTVCCGQTRKTVSARAGWKKLTAVTQGDVVPVDDSIASEWGPRIVLFVQTIASAVKTLEAHQA